MRLRTLHAVLFAALALALTLCGACAALFVAGNQLEAQIGAEMAAISGEARSALDRNLHGSWRDIRVLGSVARTVAPTPEARRVWVDAMRRAYPAYAWIGFADRDGVVTASTGRILEGASVGQRPWFAEGLNAPSVGDVHKALLLAQYLPATADGSPWRFIDFSAPVRDASGVVEGVVGAHLSWSWAEQLTHAVVDSMAARAPGTEVIVVDKDGGVILGPPNLLNRPLRAASEVLRRAATEDGYAVETWPDGVSYLVGASLTRGMEDYPGLGWTVLVRQPAAIAFAPARSLARKLLGGGLSLALAAAVIGVAIGRRVGRPLDRLSEAADALARAPGAKPALMPEGSTEVRRLAYALDRMWAAVAERDHRLAEANRDLEARVEERTRELDCARRTAEQASRAKTDFLATMSHEIRTPLNGVIGYADILVRDGGLGAEQRRAAERIHGAGNALLTVVNDILDFSKIEAGEIELDVRPFRLDALVDDAVAIVEAGARPTDLALRASIGASVPGALLGDASRLRQILLNLLNNAVKFTRQGSVSLDVMPLECAADGCTLRFRVTDTGIGIPADRLDRLFRRFSQVDGSIGREFGGTGLGLAISHQLVERMGGTMSVESTVGVGSTFAFTLTLPLAPDLAPTVAASAPERAGGGLRILLADDVALNQDLARAFLEAAGHAVDVVCDGAAAVRAVQDRPYDLLLMDVRMPVVDGLAATRRIRALAHPAAGMTIVAMTANVLPEEVAKVREAGMDDHIGKPFKRADLYALLDRWSARRRAEAA